MGFKKKLKRRFDASFPAVETDTNHLLTDQENRKKRNRITILVTALSIALVLTAIPTALVLSKPFKGGGSMSSSATSRPSTVYSNVYTLQYEIYEDETFSLRNSSVELEQSMESTVYGNGSIHVTIVQQPYIAHFRDSYLSSCSFNELSINSFTFTYDERELLLKFEFAQDRNSYVVRIAIFDYASSAKLVQTDFSAPF